MENIIFERCKDCRHYGVYDKAHMEPCKSCECFEGFATKWEQKLEPVETDMVNHPNHYKTESGLETIDVIEAFTCGLKGIEAVDTANIIKYICRWKKKNGLEDLKKAKWYLEHLINKIVKENE